MGKVLVTGANGFVGKALLREMVKQDIPVIAAVRKDCQKIFNGIECVEVSDLSGKQDWSPVLKDIDSVVHTAARVHIMEGNESKTQYVYNQVNTEATLNLARQAVKADVRRFIFLSTIKVNGEVTQLGTLFNEKIKSPPVDYYAFSKWKAEQGLMHIAEETGMEVVIIRPPLIYGPGVKGNLAKIIKSIRLGIPLPLGALNNRRSLLAMENLVNFIQLSLTHPKAANETFVLADGEDVSTTQLLKKVAAAMNKKVWLLPVPISWMAFPAKLFGKQALVERLFGSLQVDSKKARELLKWSPVISMDEQLKEMVNDSNLINFDES